MIQPASFIGFALAFVVVAGACSALLSSVFHLARGWLRRRGASVERRAAAYSILLPPVLAFSITGFLAVGSLLDGTGLFEDHCTVHPHHLHLCLQHGSSWAGFTPPAVALSAALAVLGTRLTLSLSQWWRAHVALGSLMRSAGRIRADHRADVLVVASESAFCFLGSGRRPVILVSTAAWERFDARERRAVIEHELAHFEQKDIRVRRLLSFASLLGFPAVTTHVLAAWDDATERLCDRRSASAVGAPSAVAGALAKLARSNQYDGLAMGANFASTRGVIERVEAILRDEPEGHRAAAWIRVAVLLCMCGLLAACAVFAEPLHHALETVVGLT